MPTYLTVTAEQEENFIVCRTLGHAWDEISDPGGWSPMQRVWKWRICLRCVRCGCERYDGINVNGEVGSREYRYPINYKYAVHQTPTRVEFRKMMLKRRKEKK